MNEAVLRQVWPIFRAEGREILQAIATGVLALERAHEAELSEAVRRHAHSLKGSAASVGADDVVALSHAVEDALCAVDHLPALPRATVERVLRALNALDAALEAAVEPGPMPIPGAAELVATLRAPVPGVPEAAPPPGAMAAVEGGPPSPQAPAPPVDSTPAASEATPVPAPGGAGSAPASRPSAPARAPGAPAGGGEDRSIRVQAGTLEQISAYVESLALGHAAAEHRARELVGLGAALREALHAAEVAEEPAARAVALGQADALGRALERMGAEAQREALRQRLEAAAVRDDVRDLRMVPVGLALEPLHWTARDAAGKLGKEVELELVGQELRLDRRIVDALKDPLVHLVRNAVDHGVEPAGEREAAGKPRVARIGIRVTPHGRRVSVRVSDDGRGLAADRIRERAVARKLLTAEEASRRGDAEVLRLVFAPGFSTAERVTSISGRGVGLDVVQTAVARLQGTVTVSTVPGQGATFELDLPVSLAVSLAVVVRFGQELTAIPAEAVERVVRVGPGDRGVVVDRQTVRVGEEELPYAALRDLLTSEAGVGGQWGTEATPALLLRLGERRLALAVDEVLGERELVVRGLGQRGAAATLLAGAAALEDGRLLSVLNPAALLGQVRAVPAAERRPRVVVADDALTSRAAVKGILELAGYTVLPAADGEEAWQHVLGGGVELVVSDVQMPRLDGLGLARRLKGHAVHRGIPMILVTSLAGPEDRRAGLEAGADAYLVKREVEGGALLQRVRMLLGA